MKTKLLKKWFRLVKRTFGCDNKYDVHKNSGYCLRWGISPNPWPEFFKKYRKYRKIYAFEEIMRRLDNSYDISAYVRSGYGIKHHHVRPRIVHEDGSETILG